MNNALLAAPLAALELALRLRALTPRAARIAQARCDLARAVERGHDHEADALTRRICREMWAK